MEDVTDTVFRRIVAECAPPDVFFTEFVSSDGMFSPGAKRVMERLDYTEEEKPLIAQIWGNNPENYFKAARLIAERGFNGVDINMGCPVKKITSKGCCSALIDNPALAKELVLAAREGARHIPISVKTRLGYKQVQTEKWIGFLLELDLPAITVHGRVAKHQSKYPADWEEIGKVVRLNKEMKKSTIIIGNGDVFCGTDINEKHEQYQVDGIMIGRGIFNDLFIFGNHIKSLRERSVEEKLNLLLRHLSLFKERWGEKSRYATIKRFYKVYINNFSQAGDLRAKLMESTQLSEAIEIIEDFSKA